MKTYRQNDKELKVETIIKRNKHTYMRIKDDIVYVTTNKQMLHLIDQIIYDKYDELYVKTHKVIKEKNDEIKIRGHRYHFDFNQGTFKYAIMGDTIYANGQDINQTKKLIYLNEIKKMVHDIHPKVIEIIEQNHIFELPIKYKYLHSKFGSYHKKRDEITLNTFLATLEIKYLEYVLLHEYAHKIVFNHSKDFYDILDSWMKGHKIIQKALKKMVIQ